MVAECQGLRWGCRAGGGSGGTEVVGGLRWVPKGAGGGVWGAEEMGLSGASPRGLGMGLGVLRGVEGPGRGHPPSPREMLLLWVPACTPLLLPVSLF